MRALGIKFKILRFSALENQTTENATTQRVSGNITATHPGLCSVPPVSAARSHISVGLEDMHIMCCKSVEMRLNIVVV